MGPPRRGGPVASGSHGCARNESCRTCYDGAKDLFRRRVDAAAAHWSDTEGALGNVCAYSIVSFESTEGTNWLLMNRPVDTAIFLPVAGTLICAMVAIVGCAVCRRRWVGASVGRWWAGVIWGWRPGNKWRDCSRDKQDNLAGVVYRWRGSDRRPDMQMTATESPAAERDRQSAGISWLINPSST